MNRMRTLLVVGVFMLSLIILAALEFRVQDEVPSEGQMVTGSLSKDGPALPKLPGMGSPDSSGNGVLVPLDNGTLRTSNEAVDMGAIPPDEENAASESGKAEPAAPAVPAAPTAENSLPAEPVTPVIPAEPAASGDAKQSAVAPPVEEEAPQKPVEKPQKPAERKQEKTQDGVVVLTTKAPAKLAPGQTAITATRLELGKSVTFRISGAVPLKTKTLLLKDPNRYVVDLQGNWGIQLPNVPKDLWISGIRMGQHEHATRLVFELTRAPVSASVVKINDTTIEVRIK